MSQLNYFYILCFCLDKSPNHRYLHFVNIFFVLPGSYYLVSGGTWLSSMTSNTLHGSYSPVQTGPTIKLVDSGSYWVQNTFYNQNPIQQRSGFVCSFQIMMGGDGDELFFYVGASGPVGCGVSCNPITNNGGVVVGFDVFSLFGGGARRTGAGIYLMNGAGKIVASAAFSANNAWETVTIIYSQGTSNTWVVTWKGDTVLTYSDANNTNWVSSAGNYWGFGGRDGGATGNFFIGSVNLIIPCPAG